MPDNTWTIEKFAKLLKTLENISDEELIARQKNLKSLMHWSRQMWVAANVEMRRRELDEEA